MANGSILCVHPDKDIPRPLLDQLSKVYAEGHTATAIVIDGSSGVLLQPNGTVDVDSILAMREAYKQAEIYIGFFDNPVDEDDLQPFILKGSDDATPHIVCLAEGNFSKYALEGSKREPVWFAVQNTIQKKVDQFDRLTKGDVSLIMDELGNEEVSQEFADALVDRGMIAIISDEGPNADIFVNCENRIKEDWGWV